MVFSSVYFLFGFLPLVLLGYYVMPRKLKNFFLLLASLVFYGFETPHYLLLLMASILINYGAGLLMAHFTGKQGPKKVILILCVALNLGMLFYYKYLPFVVGSLDRFLHLSIPIPEILMPIGISFFTFQGMSYAIDVYRGDAAPNRNLLDMGLYISLFPQLIAGPIVKYKDIDQQLRGRRESLDQFAGGVERFAIGLAKKVLVADVLGVTVDRVFGMMNRGMDTPTAWLALFCYAMQIYFDFSGYSDMAIGLGKMFGFQFMENFRYPYISTSISEFWRRWHISLSTWFRDYLYIPLGGNRRGNVYLHLLIVFIATGIWHGANWQFLIWGLWFGVFIILERLIRDRAWYQRIPKLVKWAVTFLIVLLGWVLFRAPGVQSALQYYGHLFGLRQSEFVPFSFAYYFDKRIAFTLLIACVAATPLGKHLSDTQAKKPAFVAVKRLAILGLLALCIVYLVNGTYSPFIYFRF